MSPCCLSSGGGAQVTRIDVESSGSPWNFWGGAPGAVCVRYNVFGFGISLGVVRMDIVSVKAIVVFYKWALISAEFN